VRSRTVCPIRIERLIFNRPRVVPPLLQMQPMTYPMSVSRAHGSVLCLLFVNLPTTMRLPLHTGDFHLTHRFDGNLEQGTLGSSPSVVERLACASSWSRRQQRAPSDLHPETLPARPTRRNHADSAGPARSGSSLPVCGEHKRLRVGHAALIVSACVLLRRRHSWQFTPFRRRVPDLREPVLIQGAREHQ
jgi:hypothetical protein